MAHSNAELRDWSALPADIVRSCAALLQCDLDRLAMILQCRAWQHAIRPLPRSRQLPWMLVPFRYSGLVPASLVREAHFFCFLSARAHRLPIPPFGFGARFVGAFEGRWVLLALGHNSEYCLLNFGTGGQYAVPDNLTLPAANNQLPVVIRAAAFSSSPAEPSTCVVACIVSTFERPFMSRTFVCFSRLGASVHSCAVAASIEDVIHFEQSFYCLTQKESMVRCTPNYEQGSSPNSLRVDTTNLEFRSPNHGCGLYVKGRYLVASRGELLLVVRYNDITSDGTCCFGLFAAMPPGVNETRYSWRNLPSLDGRMIFLGKGCSRSYEVSQYPRRHEGVYFLDDDTFNHAAMIAFGGDARRYHCHDNGCWPGLGKQVKKWYDWQVPSIYTPPMWILH